MYLFLVVAALVCVVEEMCFGWIHRTVLLAVNFRAFSLQSPMIEARLEAAKRAVADAYAARDAARHETEREGLGYFLAQRRLDAAWKELIRLGGVAFFCGAPADRKLQTKGGRHQLKITLCLAMALFATTAVAAELDARDQEDIARLRQKARAAQSYLAKPTGSCNGVTVARELTHASFVLVMVGISRGPTGEDALARLADPAGKLKGLIGRINTQAARELILAAQGKMQGRACPALGHAMATQLRGAWRDVPNTAREALQRELKISPEEIDRLIWVDGRLAGPNGSEAKRKGTAPFQRRTKIAPVDNAQISAREWEEAFFQMIRDGFSSLFPAMAVMLIIALVLVALATMGRRG